MLPKQIDIIDDFKLFLNKIFDEAIEKGASDIHIEPQKDNVIIRYRIDWEIVQFYRVDSSNKDNLITRMKIISKLKIDENRLPQDGQIVYQYRNWTNLEDVDMRVSTLPILYWEKIVIRILKKDMKLLNIDSLGFLHLNLKLIKKALTLKEGLILVGWSTWSWKTTTLYAILNYFDPGKFNISTLEDPIEYKLPYINQSQVNPEIWYNFSNWLKTLLRQDPDIILVWEIRDKETAKLAIEASMTWHLVLGTIHANRWTWVVERLVNMWIDPYLIASSLKMIVSQRLVRKVCKCANKSAVTEEDAKVFKDWLWPIWNSIKDSINFKQKTWCDNCLGSGYSWRIWLHEVVLTDSDFTKIIAWDMNSHIWDDLMQTKWYLSLYQDWLLKVASGLTDLAQVLPFKEF